MGLWVNPALVTGWAHCRVEGYINRSSEEVPFSGGHIRLLHMTWQAWIIYATGSVVASNELNMWTVTVVLTGSAAGHSGYILKPQVHTHDMRSTLCSAYLTLQLWLLGRGLAALNTSPLSAVLALHSHILFHHLFHPHSGASPGPKKWGGHA